MMCSDNHVENVNSHMSSYLYSFLHSLRFLFGFLGCILLLSACATMSTIVGLPEPEFTGYEDRLTLEPIQAGESVVYELAVGNSSYWANMTLAEINLDSKDGAFSLVDDPPRNRTVGPGDTVDLAIEFAPDSAGSYQASLLVTSERRDEPVTLSLYGEAEASGPEIGLTSDTDLLDEGAINLGTVAVNEERTVPVMVRNPGDEPLRIEGSSTTVDGLEAPPLPSSIEPGEEELVEFVLRVSEPGEHDGRIAIESNALESKQGQIELLFVVEAPDAELSAEPSSVGFGRQVKNTSTGRQVTVTNHGDREVVVTPSVGGDGFSLEANGDERSLAAGEELVLPVAFRPTEAGSIVDGIRSEPIRYSGELEIFARDAEEGSGKVTERVPLSGAGVNYQERRLSGFTHDGTIGDEEIFSQADLGRIPPDTYVIFETSVESYGDFELWVPDTGYRVESSDLAYTGFPEYHRTEGEMFRRYYATEVSPGTPIEAAVYRNPDVNAPDEYTFILKLTVR